MKPIYSEVINGKTCPVCGKHFAVIWTRQWAYRRPGRNTGSERFFGSWKCLREFDKTKGVQKMGAKRIFTKEQEAEAVRIALDGGSPLEFLEQCGGTNPAQKWYDIKNKLKETDPETWAKLPAKLPAKNRKTVETPEGEYSVAGAMANMKDAAEEFFSGVMGHKVTISAPETPETPRICRPVNYDGMTVREVEGLFGRYRRSDVNEKTYIDYEPVESLDVMSYTVEQWRSFREETEHAARILGVEL